MIYFLQDEYNNSVYMSLRAHACNTDYIDFRLTFESRLHRPQANGNFKKSCFAHRCM